MLHLLYVIYFKKILKNAAVTHMTVIRTPIAPILLEAIFVYVFKVSMEMERDVMV